MAYKLNRRAFLILSGGSVIAAACGGGGSDSSSTSSSSGDVAASKAGTPATLRLGYFPNLTHVQPNVGLENGAFARTLSENVKLEPKAFNAGPSVIEAMFAGAIDASYIGPSPAINGYVQSQGKELRIIAGATSGGALLVVRKNAGISKASDFANKKIATPQLGNTQDVAARAWLKKNGLNAKEQGGNVNIIPTANAQQIALFQKGDIDAAWAPEPWGTRLIQEADGQLFLDEREIWPNKQFVVTHLIVATKFLKDRPDVVENLLKAHVEVTDYIKANAADARTLLNKRIEKDTNAAIPARVLEAAWANQDITFDPIASSLRKAADDAAELGFLQGKPDLKNIYDLTLLNKVLAGKNVPAVKGL
jgi:NitT/TauT family transport system substrate-binding protein